MVRKKINVFLFDVYEKIEKKIKDENISNHGYIGISILRIY